MMKLSTRDGEATCPHRRVNVGVSAQKRASVCSHGNANRHRHRRQHATPSSAQDLARAPAAAGVGFPTGVPRWARRGWRGRQSGQRRLKSRMWLRPLGVALGLWLVPLGDVAGAIDPPAPIRGPPPPSDARSRPMPAAPTPYPPVDCPADDPHRPLLPASSPQPHEAHLLRLCATRHPVLTASSTFLSVLTRQSGAKRTKMWLELIGRRKNGQK
jgi:hypothetical protein